MLNIIESLFVFLISTPIGFLFLVGGLVYAQYLLGKNIWETEEAPKEVVHTVNNWAVKYAKKAHFGNFWSNQLKKAAKKGRI